MHIKIDYLSEILLDLQLNRIYQVAYHTTTIFIRGSDLPLVYLGLNSLSKLCEKP